MTQRRSLTKGEKIAQSVSRAAEKYNLPESLIHAVIKQESGFNPEAESGCGARGLMQLMPETAREMGVKDSFDIEQNIDGGSRYLRQMLDRFGGDVKLALAAYNAGPSRVEQCGGIPQIPKIKETQEYVPAVLAHFENFGGTSGVGVQTHLAATINRQELASELVTASIVSNPPTIHLPHIPKIDTGDEPPPPPPTAVRV